MGILTANTGYIYNSSAGGFSLIAQNGPIRFAANSTTEAMRIATSGNIGIGVATPAQTLSVADPSNGDVSVSVTGTNSSSFLLNDLTSGRNVWEVMTYNAGYGHKLLINSANGGTRNPRIAVDASTGYVGIGTTAPSYALEVNGSVAGTSAYNNLSDARLKKNVVSIKGALAIVDQLRGVRFDWRLPGERSIGKSTNFPVGTPQVGFIAQELIKVLPEAVSVANDQDRTMSVAESKVVPVLVEAVKELRLLNARQALEISRMREELTALERKAAVHTASR